MCVLSTQPTSEPTFSRTHCSCFCVQFFTLLSQDNTAGIYKVTFNGGPDMPFLRPLQESLYANSDMCDLVMPQRGCYIPPRVNSEDPHLLDFIKVHGEPSTWITKSGAFVSSTTAPASVSMF